VQAICRRASTTPRLHSRRASPVQPSAAVQLQSHGRPDHPPLLQLPCQAPQTRGLGASVSPSLGPRYGLRWPAQRDTALSLANSLSNLAITSYTLPPLAVRSTATQSAESTRASPTLFAIPYGALVGMPTRTLHARAPAPSGGAPASRASPNQLAKLSPMVGASARPPWVHPPTIGTTPCGIMACQPARDDSAHSHPGRGEPQPVPGGRSSRASDPT